MVRHEEGDQYASVPGFRPVPAARTAGPVSIPTAHTSGKSAARALRSRSAGCIVQAGEPGRGVDDAKPSARRSVGASQVGKTYVLVALKDPIPICVNCHQFLHCGVKEPSSNQDPKALLIAND